MEGGEHGGNGPESLDFSNLTVNNFGNHNTFNKIYKKNNPSHVNRLFLKCLLS